MYGIIFTNLAYEPKVGPIIQEEYYGKQRDYIKIEDGSRIEVYPDLKIVETYEEALKIKEEYEELRKYFNANFIKYKWVMEHYNELSKLKNELDKLVEKYENLTGYDFCDVSAGGVQIRLKHKEIKNYTYGKQTTLLYDCSNINDIARLVEEAWIDADVKEKVDAHKAMIADCEKWGWD